MENNCNVLLALFPAQGQINPCLQFAKRLVKHGVNVTITTSVSVVNRMAEPPSITGVEFATFSDGYDEGFKGTVEESLGWYEAIKAKGSEAIAATIAARARDGRGPIRRVIYTTFMSWVGGVAEELGVESTLLWIQPATAFDIYYYCCTCYDAWLENWDGSGVVEFPGCPPLGAGEIPTFLFRPGSKTMDWISQTMGDHVGLLLNKEEKPIVLVNTFDALEFDALRVVDKVELIGVGPFVPSAYLDGKDLCDTCFGGDMRVKSDGYVEWLDSKPKGSVVYLAFGSYSDLPTQMMEEIAQALVQTKRPFLWVIRETPDGEKPEEKLSLNKADLEMQGKIVRWCSQVEVLQHPSVGCFVTHCGWNSTLESLVSGVPVVACPLWTDQWCNAKLIQDVWKSGVKVNTDEDKGNIVEAHELIRCIECVMGEGEGAQELRSNASKFKALAKKAMDESNGSSSVNLKTYVNNVLLVSHG